MNRRAFFSLTAATAASMARVQGANDRVRLALIGCGGRGRHVGGFMKQAPGAEFVSVCDVQRSVAERAVTWAGGPEVKQENDFRRVLERKDVDAVLIATPDHWHAAIAVMACQAGKDAYVEKPFAYSIREGRAIVEAAKRHKRIVQVGTQQRSAPHYAEIAKIIQSGQLGEVRFVRVWNYTNLTPNGIGKKPDGPVPDGVDWDMYTGPAPERAFNPLRIGPTYRYFWDYSGGTITDYGIHRFDTVHQIMGVDSPKTISASGGRFSLKDGGEMPDVLQVTYEYPGFVMSYEASNMSGHGLGGRTPGMRYYNARGPVDRPHGEAYYGTNGALFCDRIGYEIYPDPQSGADAIQPNKPGGEMALRTERKQMNTTDATSIHAKTFVDNVRNQKQPAADALVGQRSTLVAHLGNIAYKSGAKLRWDGEQERFIDGPREATELLGRKARKKWDILPS